MIRIPWVEMREFAAVTAMRTHTSFSSRHLLTASVDEVMFSCSIPKTDPANEDQTDFEANFASTWSTPTAKEVITLFEKNDKDLKLCSGETSVDTTTGECSVTVIVPGTPGSGEGRYLDEGMAFFDTATPGDRVTKVEIVDVDNIMGYGADTVLKAYHDDEQPAAKQGWRIPPKRGQVDVDTLAGYGFIPAGLYLRVTGKKAGSAPYTGTFYMGLKWGKLG